MLTVRSFASADIGAGRAIAPTPEQECDILRVTLAYGRADE